MPLRKVTIISTRWETDTESKQEVLHADDPHALVMAAGYLKYIFASDPGEGIYFRGQRKLYGSLSPSLFRGLTVQGSTKKRMQVLNSVIGEFSEKCSIFDGFGEHVREPILQHYGISTTWIDLVDNIWVALWFACHRAMSIGQYGEFVHFERRNPSQDDRFAYILLVGADIQKRNREKPGYFNGENTELIDLRMAAPSVFLRPHAQHGLLFRKKGESEGRPLDYYDQVRGIIRVDLQKALQWLGDGKMVGIHSLFPPPYYDNGYKILIGADVSGKENVGKISHIGA